MVNWDSTECGSGEEHNSEQKVKKKTLSRTGKRLFFPNDNIVENLGNTYIVR